MQALISVEKDRKTLPRERVISFAICDHRIELNVREPEVRRTGKWTVDVAVLFAQASGSPERVRDNILASASVRLHYYKGPLCSLVEKPQNPQSRAQKVSVFGEFERI